MKLRSIHILLGEQIHSSNLGWSPVYVQENLGMLITAFFFFLIALLGVMSVGFLLDSANDAVIWRGPRKNSMRFYFIFYAICLF